MSAPELYALEIPLRAYELLTYYLPDVSTRPCDRFGGPLATTFIVAMAGQMLNVPYERIHNINSAKNERDRNAELARLVDETMAKGRLDETGFYRPGLWR